MVSAFVTTFKQKAASLKSDNFYTYYRLAALTWRSNLDADERRRIEALLEAIGCVE